MATTAPATRRPVEDGVRVLPNTRSAPILFGAAIGAILLAFSFYVWGKWILSDDFGPVDTGDDPISTPALVTLRVLEVGGALALGWMVWAYAIKPRRREGRITGDGLILLAAPLVWFWDPFFNYVQTVFVYNAHLLNVGSWSSQVPGWVSPGQDQFPEPLAVGMSYIFWVFGFMLLAGRIFDAMKRRWPTMSTARFLLLAYLVCAFLNGVGEASGLLIGWFAYPGVPDALSIFDDTRWKMSLFSPLVGGLQLMLWVGVRYFRDENGLSPLERGVDTLDVSQRVASVLRFLAIYTSLTAAVLVVNLGFMFQGLHSSIWPKEVPSYLTSPCPTSDTDPTSCGGPGIPIARPN